MARGLLGQAHTRTDRATGHRTITVVVEGNVSRARRPRADTRRVRRANRTGRDTFTRPGRPGPTPGKDRPTPKRPGRPTRVARGAGGEAGLSQTFRRMPEWRTVPAPTAVGQRPAGHEPQSGHPAVVRSGRARDFQHRTGFHRARATPVLRLSADYGPRTGTTTPTRNV